MSYQTVSAEVKTGLCAALEGANNNDLVRVVLIDGDWKGCCVQADKDLKGVIDSEAVIQNVCIHSDDFKEGSRAFFESR